MEFFEMGIDHYYYRGFSLEFNVVRSSYLIIQLSNQNESKI